MPSFSEEQKASIELGVEQMLISDSHPCLEDFWEDLLGHQWGDAENPRRLRPAGVGIAGMDVRKEKGHARVKIDKLWHRVRVDSVGDTDDDPTVTIGASLDDVTSRAPRVTRIWLKSVG